MFDTISPTEAFALDVAVEFEEPALDGEVGKDECGQVLNELLFTEDVPLTWRHAHLGGRGRKRNVARILQEVPVLYVRCHSAVCKVSQCCM